MGLGFKVLGFRGLGVRGLGFRGLGVWRFRRFRVSAMAGWCFGFAQD